MWFHQICDNTSSEQKKTFQVLPHYLSFVSASFKKLKTSLAIQFNYYNFCCWYNYLQTTNSFHDTFISNDTYVCIQEITWRIRSLQRASTKVFDTSAISQPSSSGNLPLARLPREHKMVCLPPWYPDDLEENWMDTLKGRRIIKEREGGGERDLRKMTSNRWF